MNFIFKTSILALSTVTAICTIPQTANATIAEGKPIAVVKPNAPPPQSTQSDSIKETLKKLQAEAKKQAEIHTKEYTRLQTIFSKARQPKTGITLSFFDKKYKRKYQIVSADLKELNRALTGDVKTLYAPLPEKPTGKAVEKYRDLLTSFGNNASRTFKALRDELKWLKGDKKAKFEIFKNYADADKFFSKGKK